MGAFVGDFAVIIKMLCRDDVKLRAKIDSFARSYDSRDDKYKKSHAAEFLVVLTSICELCNNEDLRVHIKNISENHGMKVA